MSKRIEGPAPVSVSALAPANPNDVKEVLFYQKLNTEFKRFAAVAANDNGDWKLRYNAVVALNTFITEGVAYMGFQKAVLKPLLEVAPCIDKQVADLRSELVKVTSQLISTVAELFALDAVKVIVALLPSLFSVAVTTNKVIRGYAQAALLTAFHCCEARALITFLVTEMKAAKFKATKEVVIELLAIVLASWTDLERRHGVASRGIEECIVLGLQGQSPQLRATAARCFWLYERQFSLHAARFYSTIEPKERKLISKFEHSPYLDIVAAPEDEAAAADTDTGDGDGFDDSGAEVDLGLEVEDTATAAVATGAATGADGDGDGDGDGVHVALPQYTHDHAELSLADLAAQATRSGASEPGAGAGAGASAGASSAAPASAAGDVGASTASVSGAGAPPAASQSADAATPRLSISVLPATPSRRAPASRAGPGSAGAGSAPGSPALPGGRLSFGAAAGEGTDRLGPLPGSGSGSGAGAGAAAAGTFSPVRLRSQTAAHAAFFSAALTSMVNTHALAGGAGAGSAAPTPMAGSGASPGAAASVPPTPVAGSTAAGTGAGLFPAPNPLQPSPFKAGGPRGAPSALAGRPAAAGGAAGARAARPGTAAEAAAAKPRSYHVSTLLARTSTGSAVAVGAGAAGGPPVAGARSRPPSAVSRTPSAASTSAAAGAGAGGSSRFSLGATAGAAAGAAAGGPAPRPRVSLGAASGTGASPVASPLRRHGTVGVGLGAGVGSRPVSRRPSLGVPVSTSLAVPAIIPGGHHSQSYDSALTPTAASTAAGASAVAAAAGGRRAGAASADADAGAGSDTPRELYPEGPTEADKAGLLTLHSAFAERLAALHATVAAGVDALPPAPAPAPAAAFAAAAAPTTTVGFARTDGARVNVAPAAVTSAYASQLSAALAGVAEAATQLRALADGMRGALEKQERIHKEQDSFLDANSNF